MRVILVGLLLLGPAFTGCGSDQRDSGEIRVLSRGDTTRVEVPSSYDSLSVPVQVRVLWRDPSLGRPVAMVASDDQVIVGDGDRIHVLTRAGQLLQSVGREGEGPGEFLQVTNLGLRGDSIVVFDRSTRRWTFLSQEGRLRGTEGLVGHPDFRNVRPARPVRAHRGGLVYVANENVRMDRPNRNAVLWENPSADSVEVRKVFEVGGWRSYGQIVGPDILFGPQPLIALGPNGRLAYSDGREECVSVSFLDQVKVLEVCRARMATPVGPGVRGATVEDIFRGEDVRPDVREAFSELLRQQPVADTHPFVEEVVIGENGDLWVRVVGPNPPDVHPSVLVRNPELRPEWSRWEWYDPDGRPKGTVRMPRSFLPMVFEANSVLGFLELPSGEVVVGVAEVQGA